MLRVLKRRLALTVAIGAVLIGGTAVALGATSSKGHHSHRGNSTLAVAAKYLGLSVKQLKAQLQSGKTLAQVAVADGHSEAGLVSAIVASRQLQLTSKVTAQVNRTAKGRGAHKSARRGAVRSAVLSYLGLSKAELTRELRAGKSLAQLAGAAGSGRSSAGLVEAVLTVRTQRLDQAVSDGKLSQKKADERLARLRERIATLVARTHALQRHSSH